MSKCIGIDRYPKGNPNWPYAWGERPCGYPTRPGYDCCKRHGGKDPETAESRRKDYIKERSSYTRWHIFYGDKKEPDTYLTSYCGVTGEQLSEEEATKAANKNAERATEGRDASIFFCKECSLIGKLRGII